MILLWRSKEETAAPGDNEGYAVPRRVLSSHEVPIPLTAKKVQGLPMDLNPKFRDKTFKGLELSLPVTYPFLRAGKIYE